MTAISRAPLTKLQAYKRRMGWSFPWASSTRPGRGSAAVTSTARVVDEEPRSASGAYCESAAGLMPQPVELEGRDQDQHEKLEEPPHQPSTQPPSQGSGPLF